MNQMLEFYDKNFKADVIKMLQNQLKLSWNKNYKISAENQIKLIRTTLEMKLELNGTFRIEKHNNKQTHWMDSRVVIMTEDRISKLENRAIEFTHCK